MSELSSNSATMTAEPAVDEPFRRLYDLHGTAVMTHLLRLTNGDRHQAEDILQETLLRAWRHPEARAGNGEWSRAWLLTVARRIAIDHLRAATSRPTEVAVDRLDEQGFVSDDVERLIDRAEVRNAVADLPERFREVLVEVFYRERTGAEAAAALDVPVGTVRSRTYYALSALREALVERGYLPPGRP